LLNNKSQHIDIPEDIKYLESHINRFETGKLSYFTKYQRFGPGSEECARLVMSCSPTICFVSCFAYSYAKEVIDLAVNIKKLQPGLSIVVGGAGVSAYPIYFIRDTSIDFAISGEAEISLAPFIHAVLSKNKDFSAVPNLFWKEDRKIRVPASLRFTSNEEIEPVFAKVHETKRVSYYSVSISRGCKKKCKFCSNFMAHGPEFRVAIFEKIKSTIDRISIDRKKQVFINFEDDNLLFDSEYFLKVMSLFREKFGNISFIAENGIDYNLLTPFLADRLILAGLCRFNFTLASITDDILEKQQRIGSKTHFQSIVRHISSKNIPVLSYFICGLAGDTKESIANVLAFLNSVPTQVGISMFYAVPGLPDFDDMTLFEGLKPYLCNGTASYPWCASLSTTVLITAFRLSRYVNLLKSPKKDTMEVQLIEKIKQEKKLFTLIKGKTSVEIAPAPGTDDELVRLFLEK
jgi:radical SAM superfamily enzyme YgiQ (UPF0313 family)